MQLRVATRIDAAASAKMYTEVMLCFCTLRSCFMTGLEVCCCSPASDNERGLEMSFPSMGVASFWFYLRLHKQVNSA